MRSDGIKAGVENRNGTQRIIFPTCSKCKARMEVNGLPIMNETPSCENREEVDSENVKALFLCIFKVVSKTFTVSFIFV